MKKRINGILRYSCSTFSTYSASEERHITKEHQTIIGKVFTKSKLD